MKNAIFQQITVSSHYREAFYSVSVLEPFYFDLFLIISNISIISIFFYDYYYYDYYDYFDLFFSYVCNHNNNETC